MLNQFLKNLKLLNENKMSTNYLTAAITAYEALSDYEKDLFYKVIYHAETKDCCEAKETEVIQVEEKSNPKEDTSKVLKEYLEKIKNLPNIPSPISKPNNPFDSIRNYPTLISISKDAQVAGYGLTDGLYIHNDFIK